MRFSPHTQKKKKEAKKKSSLSPQFISIAHKPIFMKCFAILSTALFLVQSLADPENNDPVTCGSSIKLLHDPTVSCHKQYTPFYADTFLCF